MKKIIFFFLPILSFAQTLPVKFQSDPANKKVDVLIDNKPFTSYIYPSEDVLKKPVLYPVLSAEGHFVTRGWPFAPRKNERVDHPHHVGVWLNHGDVNGNDFWNNSNNVDHVKTKYGTIYHTGIKSMKAGKKAGTLVVTADWKDSEGKLILKEETEYVFSGTVQSRTIDRKTTLTAVEHVDFKDNKEGLFAIRLARELELPSKGPGVFTDANGIETKVAQTDNTGISGNYRNDQGIEGDAVWSKRSEWMNLTGKIENEEISLAIFDHPKNPNFPSQWHARGYGLYAINPIGNQVFQPGSEDSNIELKAGEKLTFHYELVIASKHLGDDEMNAMAQKFQSKK